LPPDRSIATENIRVTKNKTVEGRDSPFPDPKQRTYFFSFPSLNRERVRTTQKAHFYDTEGAVLRQGRRIVRQKRRRLFNTTRWAQYRRS
jgi:hypothetical protein